MPKIELKIPHELTQAEALNRIQHILPQIKSQHLDKINDLEESWSGSKGQFRFKISGFKVSGTLQVEESAVVIKGEIPILAAPFKGQIESTIKQHAKDLLEKK